MDNQRVLNKKHLDALKEVGTIGAGHAANALSQLTDKKIMISVPEVKSAPFEKIVELVGPPESLVSAVYMKLMGDMRGRTLLIFPKRSAFNLVDILMKRPAGHETKFLSEIDNSALKEVGNILTGAFLTALADFLDISLIPSVPQIAYDLVGGILESVAIDISEEDDYTYCLQTEFADPSLDITGSFLLVMDDRFLDNLIEKIDMKIAGLKHGTE